MVEPPCLALLNRSSPRVDRKAAALQKALVERECSFSLLCFRLPARIFQLTRFVFGNIVHAHEIAQHLTTCELYAAN